MNIKKNNELTKEELENINKSLDEQKPSIENLQETKIITPPFIAYTPPHTKTQLTANDTRGEEIDDKSKSEQEEKEIREEKLKLEKKISDLNEEINVLEKLLTDNDAARERLLRKKIMNEEEAESYLLNNDRIKGIIANLNIEKKTLEDSLLRIETTLLISKEALIEASPK